ncbi:MAG: hypothetical protein ABSE69_11045 [Roseiarcus sp.]|jgi:hypothetical protein
MYVPPYEALVRSLGTTPSAIASAKSVAIPGALLKLLLQMAVAYSDFDEERYLRANPDVKEAVERGEIESGHVHYVGFGYFEGRLGGMDEVDENWYLRAYPDVAQALRENQVASASQHFYLVGGGEGRSPNADQQENATRWNKTLRGG